MKRSITPLSCLLPLSLALLVGQLTAAGPQSTAVRAPSSSTFNKIKDRTTAKDFVVKNESESIYVYGEDGQKYSVKIPIAPKNLHPAPSSGVVEPGKTYQLTREQMTYTVPSDIAKDEFYLVEVTGIGRLSVTIADENDKEIARHIIPLDDLKVPTFVIFDTLRYLGQKGHKLKMQNMAEPTKLEFWTLMVKKALSLELQFNSSVRIVSTFAKTIKIKSQFTGDFSKLVPDTRYQFTAETSLDSQQLTGDERISMHINGRAKRFPTKNDFEQKASANYGNGLVKTISRNNPSFCNTEGCVYFVTVETRDVESFYFYPALMTPMNMYSFSSYMELLEELEAGESLYYELVPPKTAQALLIRILPIERLSRCFLSIGWAAVKDDDFLHRFESDRASEFYLTEEEYKAIGLSNNRIYVKCTGLELRKSSTFHLKAAVVKPGKVPELQTNSLETGATFHKEIINYMLDFKEKTSKVVNIGFALKVTGGSGIIIVKECTLKNPNCRVEASDIKLIQTNPAGLAASNIILKYTTTEYEQGISRINNLALNFRCDPNGNSAEGEEDYYLSSKTCKFALGLLFNQNTNSNDLRYELESSASNNHISLKDKVSWPVKAESASIRYFKVSLDPTKYPNGAKVNVKLFVLTGRANLYMSNSNPYPFDGNHEKLLAVQHETGSYLETKTYNITVFLKAQNLKNDHHLYLTLAAEKYTILDILPTVSTPDDTYLAKDASRSKISYEVIHPEMSYSRAILAENSFKNAKNQTVFYQNFVFAFPSGNVPDTPLDNLEINVNTNTYALKLCVYKNTKADVTKEPCDFKTNIEHLLLSKSEIDLSTSTTLLISVQKTTSKETAGVRLPIEFSLFTSVNDEESAYELHLPGSTLRTFVIKGRNIKIKFDLTTMVKTAMLFFSSEDAALKVDIFKQTDRESFLITTLSNQAFGMLIQNAEAFKTSYCKDTCSFYAFAYTTTLSNLQFSFTYTADDRPVILKDGLTLKVPNSQPCYFLYEAGADSNVNFNAYSSKVRAVAYSRLVARDILSPDLRYSDEINDIKFDLKSDIDHGVQIVYSQAELKQKAAELILFLLEPKFGMDQVVGKLPFTLLSDPESSKVYVQTQIVKLEGFLITADTIGVGEMKYYAIQFKEAIDFSVTTMSVEGAVTMYVEKGENEYPTTERFWKRSSNPHGDIIVTRTTEYASAASTDYSFVVGVYGVENSKFSIILLPQFKNLLKVEFQKIVDLKLEPGSYYYLDFFARENRFESMIYIDENDVEVATLTYSESHHQDLIGMIGEEKNFVEKQLIQKGGTPLFEFNKVNWEPQSHVVVRLLTMERPARVNFLLFDPNQPIAAPVEKRFHFVQNKKNQSIFKVKLNNKAKQVMIDVKVHFGQISVSVSDKLDGFSVYTNVQGAGQKYIPFEVTNSENDIILFKEVYIKVLSSKFSKFGILVQPKDRFKHVLPSEPEIVFSDEQRDTYLYFYLLREQMATVRTLELEIHSVVANREKPDLLFTSPSQKAPDANSVFQKMQIREFEERNMDDTRYSLYQLQPADGFYVVKIPKNPNRFPTRVNFVLNKVKTVEPNGLYHGLLPTGKDSADSLSMYVSEPGEYRLVLESCVPINVQNLIFKGDKNNNQTRLEGNLMQTYPVIILDETKEETERQLQKISYPIIRGQTDFPGLLSFKISAGGAAADPDLELPQKTYALMSEFKPSTKQLILKDYVEIFKNDASFKRFAVNYEFLRAESRLKLTISHPTFKMQLLSDYPNLQRVQLKFKVYLFSQPNFRKQVGVCGFSAIETYEKASHVITVDIPRAELETLENDKKIDVFFEKPELERFAKNEFLNIVCYLSARFFDSEEEEWQVTMNLKYTNVPYFFLTINNRYLSAQTMKVVLIASLVFIASLLLCFYTLCNSKRRNQHIENVLKEVKGEVVRDGDEEAESEDDMAEPVTSIMSETEKFDTSAN